jgi:glycogen synthase
LLPKIHRSLFILESREETDKMKVFMLGWEYPPHISGGLGTACAGLTTALARLGVDIDFVVPRVFGNENAKHMTLVDSHYPESVASDYYQSSKSHDYEHTPRIGRKWQKLSSSVNAIGIPALLSPYWTAAAYEEICQALSMPTHNEPLTRAIPSQIAQLMTEKSIERKQIGEPHYSGDLFTEVERYTQNVLDVAERRCFDVIHAHDWMTYPAGITLSRLTGAPLVVHVHSLEFDRSGDHVNPRIHEIEHAGLNEARLIIAVSHYTRAIIHERHGVPLERIAVVHNGIYSTRLLQSYRSENGSNKSKVVLFLGRITFQKGPDYFVEAAARVIPFFPDVTFVMAGTGDMLPQLVDRVARLGIAENFAFTGFLRGRDVERMYSMADLYIMPSVSEPFGISALEAMNHDVPVVISRQSGVCEVLNNALKVDFWDVDRLANLITGVLNYPEVREDIVKMAREEVRQLHWGAAAGKTLGLYQQMLANKAAS